MAQDLTQGKPFSVLLRFSLPIIGGSLFQLFYTLADTIIVGRTLGADALAAVGASASIINLVLLFVQGFTSGFGICLGQRCGANDEPGMRRSVAVSWLLSIGFAVLITTLSCGLSHPILHWMKAPADVYDDAYTYMFIILLGTGATIFYNMISNMLRALGDSKTPLIFLVFSSLLNIVLDIVCIVPLRMGVAGAAWATVASQLLSALLSLLVGLRRFPVLRVGLAELRRSGSVMLGHLRLGFTMGFQMSVMCIGVLAMQVAVNSLGSAAIAGYTAATKVDQLSVLVDNAFGVAICNYVAQNYGARRFGRIRDGVRASLIQTSAANLVMCALILLCRSLVVPLFINAPTPEIVRYANLYLICVAPFYVILGLLIVYRSTVQSMGNGRAPFAACIVELVMRISATFGLAHLIGYTGVCFATPLAWIGATMLVTPVYYSMMKEYKGLL